MSVFANFVAFDLETTGLEVDKNEIIEVAGVRFTLELKNGHIVTKNIANFESLVRPNMRIPPDATAVNNITNEMVESAPNIGDVLKDFAQFCGISTILVAHNAEFDARFLAAALKKTSLMSIKNPILDSLKVSRNIMPESPNHKLVTLAKRLRRQIDVAFDESALHRALYDCEVLREVFVAILKKRLQPKDFELSNFLRAVEKVHGPSIALKL